VNPQIGKDSSLRARNGNQLSLCHLERQTV
jgi:hypothetical protein